MSAARKILPMFIPHLGCPHACVFCNQKRISGAQHPATAADVSLALRALSPEQQGVEAAFYGGSFTALPTEQQRSLLEAVQPFRADGTVSAIRLSTRPDAIDDEKLTLLAELGVTTIELGAQSMSDDVLNCCGRGHTAADTLRVSALVRERGFHLILQMMTGLPGSSMETDVDTARKIAALHPDGVRIYPTVILRDTPLYDLWRSGDYAEHSVEDAVAVCAEIVPIFDAAGIPVIRLGLNPTDDLSGGDAAAGAYHPALGELVRSRIFLNSARSLLSSADRGADVTLAVSGSSLSQMIGQHRGNLAALKEEFCLRSLRVIADEAVPRGKVRRTD